MIRGSVERHWFAFIQCIHKLTQWHGIIAIYSPLSSSLPELHFIEAWRSGANAPAAIRAPRHAGAIGEMHRSYKKKNCRSNLVQSEFNEGRWKWK